MQSDSGEGFSEGASSERSIGITPKQSVSPKLVESTIGCLVGMFVLTLLGCSSALVLGLCARIVRWVGGF